MNALLIAAVLGLQNSASEPFVEFRVTRENKPFGKAYLKSTRTADNGFRTILTMMLEDANGKVRVRTESEFDVAGKPLSKSQEIDLHEGKTVAKFSIKFSPNGASVLLDSGGKVTKTEHPLDPTLPVADPTVIWFRETQPNLGERRSYYAFNPSELRWALLTSEYAEKKVASFDGRKIEIQLIRTLRNGEFSDSWVERDGSLVKFSGEGITLERVWAKLKSPS